MYQKVFVKEKKAHGFLKKIVEGIDMKDRKPVTRVIFHLQLNSSGKASTDAGNELNEAIAREKCLLRDRENIAIEIR